jgi:hypothetical protein
MTRFGGIRSLHVKVLLVPYRNLEEYNERLEGLKEKIQGMYTEGKISESSYERLNNKVSRYQVEKKRSGALGY